MKTLNRVIFTVGLIIAPLRSGDANEELQKEQTIQRDIGPMEMSPLAPCDLDFSGNCDSIDVEIFQASLGRCRKDFRTSVDVLADVDGDGCITDIDQRLLFPPETSKAQRETGAADHAETATQHPGLSFNDLPPKLDLQAIPAGEPMRAAGRQPCDLDRDNDCDQSDRQLFNEALGKCLGEIGYNVLADFDGNHCVTQDDQQYLFHEPQAH
jgi:hypothetical protein